MMGYGNENSPFIKVDNKELKQKLDQDFNNLSQNFQTDINQFKQQTNTQLADRATKNELSAEVTARKSEIAVERARINSFTTLPNGSTTGDAELIDARVGADGRSYANLGSSVRGQLGKLGNFLLPKIPMIDGKNINLGTGIGNTVNLTPESVAHYEHAVVSCVEGDLFTVNGLGGSNPRLWGFIDINNKLLSVSPVSADVSNDLLLVAPKNASKLIINNSKSSGRNSYMGHDLTKVNRMDRNRMTTMEDNSAKTVENLELKLRNLELAINYQAYLVDASPKTYEVQIPDKYNAWSFVSAINDKLVIVYSKGIDHEDYVTFDVFGKTSMDGGKTWSSERLIVNTPNVRDNVTGKGKDSNGNMLMWVRKGFGGTSTHHVYRTNDGISFTSIASPVFPIVPHHIGDIFEVPTVGLMAFYNLFGSVRSWGVLVSNDNGLTWAQKEIESSLTISECPTEISGVYIKEGKILAVGRKDSSSGTRALFQIQSPDYGVNWSKTYTNVTDISLSTPSLVFDSATDTVSLYYFERGAGKLRSRRVTSSAIWDSALNWSESKVIALGTTNAQDTGNANATRFGNSHIVTYYSGDNSKTNVYVTNVPQ